MIVKHMKKHKTDVYIDKYGNFYSRGGSGFTEINHPKFSQYENDEAFRAAVDENRRPNGF